MDDDTSKNHVAIGRLSFSAAELAENFAAFMESINKAKPEAHKGKLIETMSLCTTMGPSIRLKA